MLTRLQEKLFSIWVYIVAASAMMFILAQVLFNVFYGFKDCLKLVIARLNKEAHS